MNIFGSLGPLPVSFGQNMRVGDCILILFVAYLMFTMRSEKASFHCTKIARDKNCRLIFSSRNIFFTPYC